MHAPAAHVARPTPFLASRSLGPGFRPGHPTSLQVTPDSRFPRRRSRGIGVQHGTSGNRALRASPHARQPPELPFVSRPLETSAESWSRGASGTGCSRLHARARRHPRPGPACGLLAASPTRSPLFPLGPRPARQLSFGSQSLYHPLAQAPSAFIHPLGFHPDCLLGSFL